MNNQLTKLKSVKREEGFTIIEVLIVLAIGALIILAVLLAVPALQQNQKNSQRKSEAARVATGVTNYVADGGSTAAANFSTANTDVKGRSLTDKDILKTVSFQAANTTLTATGTTVNVYIGTACSGTASGTAANGSYAVVYALDNGGTACITTK